MRTSPTGPKPHKADPGRDATDGSTGFTLLELMIVMVVISVFLSLISIRIDGFFSGGDLRQASRLIAGQIALLRGKAVYERKERILGLNIDEDSIYFVDDTSTEEASWGGRFDPDASLSEIVAMPRGVHLTDVVVLSQGKIQSGEARIRIFKNGFIENALIHLQNEDEDVYTLLINPATGTLTIHDRYIEERFAEE